jgi:hypothetical protein
MRPILTGTAGAAVVSVIEYRHIGEAIWPHLVTSKGLENAVCNIVNLDDATLLGVTIFGFMICEGAWMIFVKLYWHYHRIRKHYRSRNTFATA